MNTADREVKPEAILQQLDRLRTHLARAPQLRKILSFAVRASLDGRPVNDYSIATEALGRPNTHDCRVDSIVRVQFVRLRQKLDDYYRTEGRNDPIVISFPRGSYRPSAIAREFVEPFNCELFLETASKFASASDISQRIEARALLVKLMFGSPIGIPGSLQSHPNGSAGAAGMRDTQPQSCVQRME